jgi:hypothetical protein
VDWPFFQRRVCLTTLPSEWAIAEQEFQRVGLKVETFQSLPDIGPHQSFSKSVREILVQFYLSEHETLLHVEDDCVFRDLSHLDQALNELPADWDIVYLGANLICWNNGEPQPERFSEYLWRVRAAWTTHAIGYNKKCVHEILTRQPNYSEMMFDQYLSNRLAEFNAYCVAPMVAYQRPRFSSIWNREDDYTPIFEESNARLR